MIRVSYGTWYEDLRAFVRAQAPDDRKIDETRTVTCRCGSNAFWVAYDQGRGAARRVCACGIDHLMLDSADDWPGARPEWWKCAEGCGCHTANVGAGFSLLPANRGVDLAVLGLRCAACGSLTHAGNRRIDYEPSTFLLNRL